MSAEILARILRHALDLPAGAPVEQLTRASTPEWDSLRHVKIVLAVQKEFGVRFSAAELIKISSYADLLRAIDQRA